jgi:hypothetical protein
MTWTEIKRPAVEAATSRYFWMVVVIGLVAFPHMKVPYVLMNIPFALVVGAVGSSVIIYLERSFLWDRFWTFASLFIIAMVISVIFAIPDILALPSNSSSVFFSKWRFIWQIGGWLTGFGVIYFFWRNVRSRVTFDRITTALVIAGVFAAAWATYELIARSLDLPYIYPSNTNWNYQPGAVHFAEGGRQILRPLGPFTEPKLLGQFLLAPILLSLAIGIFARRNLYLLASIALIYMLMLTRSTPAFAALIIALILFSIIVWRSGIAKFDLSRTSRWVAVIFVALLVDQLTGAHFIDLVTFHFNRFGAALLAVLDTGQTGLPLQSIQPVEPTATALPIEPTATALPIEPTATALPIEPTATPQPVDATPTPKPLRPRQLLAPQTLPNGTVIHGWLGTDYILGWKLGIELFLKNPIVGVGAGLSPFYSGITDHIFSPFSLYLLLLAETGIIGFSAFLAMIFSPLTFVFKRLNIGQVSRTERVRIAKLAAVASAIAGGLIGYQAYGGARFEPHDWVLIGLLLAGTTVLYKSDGEDDLADTVSSESD